MAVFTWAGVVALMVLVAAVTGVPLDVQTVAANRASFTIGSLTEEIIGTQQAVADRFHRLGLIPKPIVIRDIYARLPSIAAEGTALVIVEQDIAQALAAAEQVYCLQEGRVAFAGAARSATREAVAAAYFGG